MCLTKSVELILPVFVLLMGASAHSDSEPFQLTSDVDYKQTEDTLQQPYPGSLDKHFADLGFEVLRGQHAIMPNSALSWLDRVYVTKNYDRGDARIVFAKSGVEVDGPVQFNKIYKHPKGYVVHYHLKKNTTLVLFFRGFSQDNLATYNKEVIENLNAKAEGSYSAVKRRTRTALGFIGNQLFPMAAADDSASSNICSPTFGNDSSESQPEASALKQMWGCTKGFGGGVWDATGGSIWFVAKGAYNIVAHPIDTFDKVSDGFDSITAVMKDFSGAFGEMKSAFEQLPSDAKWKIGCEVFSSLGTSAVIAYLTAGAGSPILLREMVKALTKVASTIPKSQASIKMLEMAEKMGKKAADAQAKVEEIQKIKSGKELSDASKNYLAKSEARREASQVYEAALQKTHEVHEQLQREMFRKGLFGKRRLAELTDEDHEELEAGRQVIAPYERAEKAAFNDYQEAQTQATSAGFALERARNGAARSKELEDQVVQLNKSSVGKLPLTVYFAAAGCNTANSIRLDSGSRGSTK